MCSRPASKEKVKKKNEKKHRLKNSAPLATIYSEDDCTRAPMSRISFILTTLVVLPLFAGLLIPGNHGSVLTAWPGRQGPADRALPGPLMLLDKCHHCLCVHMQSPHFTQ